MTSYMEMSLLEPLQDFPEGHRAGHFEHVAQMNMAEDISTFLQILPKICLMKAPAEDHPDSSGLEDKNFKVPDPADSASLKDKSNTKLLHMVRRDLMLSDGEWEIAARASLKRTSKKESENSQGKEKKKENHKDEDSAEWAKARKKVEEFLDFPALIAAMNLREKTESMFSQMPSTTNSQQMACREALSIPNTKHNAVFFRDNPKAAQVILTSPLHKSEYLSTDYKMQGKEDPKEDVPPKEVINLDEMPNTNMEAETEADR